MIRVPLSIMFCSLFLAGCPSATTQLEDVAKDWSKTIRASQVIPIYPLDDDTQPGDIFIVPTSLKNQAKTYEDKGFLPIQQHVHRLKDLDYQAFYKAEYWDDTYAFTPHVRPQKNTVVKAPRAAFPSYNFEINTSKGVKLALPIKGIPVGLGFMGASKAFATVSLSDAYTYGTSGSEVYAKLLDWYKKDPKIKETLASMALTSEDEIYLRIITRIYTVKKIDVTITNLDSKTAGGDAGAAQSITLPDISNLSKANVTQATQAYQAALNALSQPLNGGLPGGSFRFTQATERAVSMHETFDTPIVVGFVGFDVRVFENGVLSAPIPSFSTLSGQAKVEAFKPALSLTKRYLVWLNKPGNRNKAAQVLNDMKINIDPADLTQDKHKNTLEEVREIVGF